MVDHLLVVSCSVVQLLCLLLLLKQQPHEEYEELACPWQSLDAATVFEEDVAISMECQLCRRKEQTH